MDRPLARACSRIAVVADIEATEDATIEGALFRVQFDPCVLYLWVKKKYFYTEFIFFHVLTSQLYKKIIIQVLKLILTSSIQSEKGI